MKAERFIRKYASFICLVGAVLLFLFSLVSGSSANSTEHAAGRLEKRVDKRMDLLDSYMRQALASDLTGWMDMDLPEDMVIYRYVFDTLQSWSNQFPISNDDISSRVVIQRLTGRRTNLVSPLKNVTEEVRYLNLGPKWYLLKSVSDDISCKVIGGLEIKNSLIENIHKSYNGVNSHLRLPGKFSVVPISDSGGSAVQYHGTPLFKIISETGWGPSFLTNSFLRWLALLLVASSSILYLWRHRKTKVFIINIFILIISAAVAYLWGFQSDSDFFSPTIYAGGQFLYSFGALMIINSLVILLLLSIYMIRGKFIKLIHSGNRKRRSIIYGSCVILLTIGITIYIALSLHSLVMNSNIQLELYLWSHISIYTVITYVAYMGLFWCILLLIQMLAPAVRMLAGKSYDISDRRILIIFSIVCALYFTATSSILGFRKEQDRVMVMSTRLALDRDLGLELILRSVENAIATDPFISELAHETRGNVIILNRLTENYLDNITQNYDIVVAVCPRGAKRCLDKYEQKILSGTPIEVRSRFFYSYDHTGKSSYTGIFPFYSEEHGLSRIVIDIEPKANREDRGYYSILGRYSNPGRVSIPAFYSYARYVSGKLVSFNGTYAYPTVIYEKLQERIDTGAPLLRANGYVHFINRITDNEAIIISRKIQGAMTYMVTFSYLLLISFFGVYLLFHKKERKAKEKVFQNNYFRSRINAVMISSLFLALIVMSILSVTFVYRRNQANMYSIMSGKISTVQTMINARCKDAETSDMLSDPGLDEMLEDISSNTKSDITVYTPGGKVFRSTTPEIFERMVIGSRMNEDAYYYIKFRNQRFYIHPERTHNNTFYLLYAPVFNEKGSMIAIICVPYTGQDLDFKQDAFFHAAAIINIFIVMILLTVLISTTFVNRMFLPLIEMGKKMNQADLHGLEYIMYRRHDEISTIVDAYNRMVHDLSISTKKLAQAERDKAWSEMARQVAHEIKNPLTPIKLEIQRLIRLKQKNDPTWSEKFDRVAAVVLEHIDILTDTANEFSTFAKLYTEEPVELDLDSTLRDQFMIFDNKDNIEMSYIGLEKAMVMAPKPQLIRVFVNLITNAVQAIEIPQREAKEEGKEPVKGIIFISLRNGVKDGYYDIVFEDNGPGVNEDNQSKLFTPNFTTKSGGTGLGLAICRNIVEKCGGEIFYQKSFSLGGACFTVSLPKIPSRPAAITGQK